VVVASDETAIVVEVVVASVGGTKGSNGSPIPTVVVVKVKRSS